MNEIVEIGGRNDGFGRRLQTIDQRVQYNPVFEPGLPESMRPPVSIHINVGRTDEGSKEKPTFSILRSKIVWLLVAMAVSGGLSYGRARSICQGFKDSGKFYYGMDVSRCVGVVIKDPLSTVERQLANINSRY